MTALPTLGGNNGAAGYINNRGEVPGYAENTTPDSTCSVATTQVPQFKPVIWEKGKIHELPTFGDDPDGAALTINDNGQVVGSSGDCGPFNPYTLINFVALHALPWEKGTATDLGNLCGTGHFVGHFATSLNNQGQVVGASDLAGDAGFHAFLWTKETGMQDLGTLPGDVYSSVICINDGGEVVGVSLDANFSLRAFVRQNGVMTDLNILIPDDSPLFLLLAATINSRGEIAGFAVQTSTSEVHAYVATPIHSEAVSESVAPAVQGRLAEHRKVVLPENARKMLQQRLGRLGARLMGPQ
jgi:probable HAF family extracellular repeat protein